MLLYSQIKSLISYRGGELDGSASQYLLRNQLYIKWSVFSENTIGGSRTTPPLCPYYKYSNPSFSCTLEEAQKNMIWTI